LSKKPCLANETNEFTVHGALSASSVASRVPIDVFMVTWTLPCTSGVSGGGFTLRVAACGSEG
jgi:hypothetical protein